MKRVLMDLMASQPEAGSKYHGGGEYIKSVFCELCNRYLDNIELTVFYDGNRFMDEWVLRKIRDNNVKVINIHTYRELMLNPAFADTDIYFAGIIEYIRDLTFSKNTKVIAVYHGFRSLELPLRKEALIYEESVSGKTKILLKLLMNKKYTQRKQSEMREMISKCDSIIGVSEHAGYSVSTFFPEVAREKVRVFYSPQKHLENTCMIDTQAREKIILLLGGNRWTKNIKRALTALDDLFSKAMLNDYSVKVIGGIPSKIGNYLNNRQRFISENYLEPEELEKAYATCDMFFYPSLNEGFGYPPLEAMKYDKTCIVGADSSLTGIYQEAVYYCAPYDINEMETRLVQAMDSKIPVDIIRKAYKRITDRQKDDLRSLCRLIVGIEND